MHPITCTAIWKPDPLDNFRFFGLSIGYRWIFKKKGISSISKGYPEIKKSDLGYTTSKQFVIWISCIYFFMISTSIFKTNNYTDTSEQMTISLRYLFITRNYRSYIMDILSYQPDFIPCLTLPPPSEHCAFFWSGWHTTPSAFCPCFARAPKPQSGGSHIYTH